MSNWTHAICEECWNKKNPNRVAVRLTDTEEEICCFCGNSTFSGIFVREDPSKIKFCQHKSATKLIWR